MIRCLPHGRFCQLPASRTTRHAHRHCCSPGRCAATCLTSQPHQARLCDTKRNNIPSAASASRSPRAATHGRLGPTTVGAATRSLPSLHADTRSLPSPHAATRSRPSLYAVARSLPSPYTATWPPHAPCYTHSRHYTPPRSRPLPHAADLSLPSPLAPHSRRATRSLAATRSLPPPHAATLAVIATRHHARCHCHTRPLSRCHRHTPQHSSAWVMARMLHVLCTVSRDHCPVRICCR